MEDKYLLISIIGLILVFSLFAIIKADKDNSNKKENPKILNLTFIEFIFYLFTFLSPFGLFAGYSIDLCAGSFVMNLFFGNVMTWFRRIYNQKYEN